MLERILYCTIIHAMLCTAYGQTLDEVGWSIPGDGEDEVVIMLMGDMNIQNRQDPASGFEYLLPTLKKADIRFCNLEGPFAGTNPNPNDYDIPHKPAWTHSDPRMVDGLVAAGFDVVGVANNVTFPSSALLRSLKVLDQEGIKHTGGGRNKWEAIAPVIWETKGTKIAFVQYACTVFPYDHAATETQPGIAEVKISTSYLPPPNLDKPGQPPIVLTQIDSESLQEMRNNITKAKEMADVVIVSYHWGVSNKFEPHPYQREIAHAAIEAGADMIFGHGAHKLQPVEVWNEKPIFYCAGNAVFDWWKIRSGLNGILVRTVVKDKKVAQVSFVPLQRDENNTPHLLDVKDGIGRELFDKINASTHIDRARLLVKDQEIEVYNSDRSEAVPDLQLAWAAEGFASPASTIFDKKREVLYVSNTNGESSRSSLDGNGFITRLNTDGTMDQLRWITGLNDPRGMDLHDDTLWITDIDQVVKVDVRMNQILDRYTIPGARLLEDISVSPDGKVFTMDSETQCIFQLHSGRFTIYWADVKRGGPKGLLAEKDRLLVATSSAQTLLSVNRANRKPLLLVEGIGQGIDIAKIDKDQYVIADQGGTIFYLSPLGYKHSLLDIEEKLPIADVDYVNQENLLIVPIKGNNSVRGYQMRWSRLTEDDKIK